MTPFQLRLCQQIADGYTTVEAARVLECNVRTAEASIARLKKEYKALTLTHLIVELVRRGDIK